MRNCGIIGVLGLLLTSACSLYVIPVDPAQVKSAKRAKEPLRRGPGAPGYFKKTWDFSSQKGFLFDPSRVEMKESALRIIYPKNQVGPFYAVVETASGAPYIVLDGFMETPGPGHKGSVKYQLSNNGSSWYYHNGKKWVPAAKTQDQANTASEVNSRVDSFHTDVGTGSLLVKVFISSLAPSAPVELQQVHVMGIAPRMDGGE